MSASAPSRSSFAPSSAPSSNPPPRARAPNPGAAAPPSPLQAPLRDAARRVNEQLDYDEHAEDALSLLSSRDNGTYRFEKRCLIETRRVALPAAIAEEFEHLNCSTFVGLFPEISRAYITVDNRLFLWDYEHGDDFVLYEELAQVIISVALVRPRPGVFVDEIEYVLVLATPVEIIMLAMEFENGNVHGGIQLFPTRFSVPSDNVHMLKVVGTPGGRVFMCGKDGHVYELEYGGDDDGGGGGGGGGGSWFGGSRSKCRKKNHSASYAGSFLPSFLFFSAAGDPVVDLVLDAPRNLLYALTRRSSVSVYDLGARGDAMRHRCTSSTVLADARRSLGLSSKARRRDWDKHDWRVVSLFPLTQAESGEAVLVAVTNHGHRIYFGRPSESSGLRVRFVRQCPASVERLARAPTARPAAGKLAQPQFLDGRSPQHVRVAFYSGGVLLMADARSADGDTLVAVTADETPASGSAVDDGMLHENVESADMVADDGGGGGAVAPDDGVVGYADTRICDLAEVPPSFYMTLVGSSLYRQGADDPLTGLNVFATQHALPARSFLCLTSTDLRVYARTRPLDELRVLLSEYARSHRDAGVRDFFVRYGVQEACAMCLILACDGAAPELDYAAADGGQNDSRLNPYAAPPQPIVSDDELQSAAASVFFSLGSDRELRAHADRGAAAPHDDRSSGARLSSSSSHRHPMGVARVRRGVWSGVHDGLYLYLARLLRPVWIWSVTVVPRSGGLRDQALRFSSEQSLGLQAPLERLRHFLGQHRGRLDAMAEAAAAAASRARDGPLAADAAEADEAARLLEERRSLGGLQALLDMCSEAFSFLRILSEQDNFARVVDALPERTLAELRDLEFCNLATTEGGKRTAWQLIHAMMKRAGGDSWVDRLHRECGHFFGDVDLLRYKAYESLEKFRSAYRRGGKASGGPPPGSAVHVADALRYLRQAAPARQFPLVEVCRRLRSVHCYSAAVDLCLHRADSLREDRGTEEAQDECYDQALVTLNAVVRERFEPDEEPDERSLPLGDAARQEMEAETMRRALGSRNETFHCTLYEWVVRHGQHHRWLVQAVPPERSRFLVRFLGRQDRPPAQVKVYLGILKEYYLTHGMWEAAAHLLLHLACKAGVEYTLNERLTFLSRGYSCAHNCQVEVRAGGAGDEADAGNDDDGAGGAGGGPGVAGDDAGASAKNNPNVIDGDTVVEFRDKLELAKIQLRMYNALVAEAEAGGTAPDDGRRQQIVGSARRLNEALLSLEELYRIAQNRGMWEVLLQMLHFSDTPRDSKIVEVLWRNTVEDAYRRSGARLAPVRDKVRALAERYADVDFMLPLEAVVRCLQDLAYRHSKRRRGGGAGGDEAESFVVDTLAGAVSAARLSEVYSRLLETAGQQKPRAKLLVFSSMLHLLRRLERDAVRGNPAWLRQGSDLCNRVITELAPMSTSPEAVELFRQFREAQSRIRL